MAQRTDFSAMACSLARSWAVIGEPWTPLILRDLLIGLHRFDQLRSDTGIAANVLSTRLRTLEEAGLVERRPYKDQHRTRDEYFLTEMGFDLVPALTALTNWGDRWLSNNRPPAVFGHSDCGASPIRAVPVCSDCGEQLAGDHMTVGRGPGGEVGPGTQLIASDAFNNAT